ncbi:Probable WRKY transcription factor 70 [Linum grandiflorum]
MSSSSFGDAVDYQYESSIYPSPFYIFSDPSFLLPSFLPSSLCFQISTNPILSLHFCQTTLPFIIHLIIPANSIHKTPHFSETEHSAVMGSSTMQMMKQRVIKELVQGRQFAAQLQLLLQNNLDQSSCSSSPSADELVVKILTSFSHAISALATAVSNSGDNQDSSAASGLYEDSGESRKRRPPPSGKDNRGSYKRRKIGQSHVIISPTIQDGQAWRKYGQKEILNAKFPRSYFRCSRKYEMGCKATKHVQRLEEESTTELYSITYVGHHTCSVNIPRAIPSIQIPTENETTESSLTKNVKQEGCVVVREDDIMNNEQSMSEVTNDRSTNMWQDLVPLEPEETISNYGYSGAASSFQISDLDFLVKNIDFESEFQFD